MGNTVGADLKAETMALMDKRTAIETEMDIIISRLSQPGAPGLSGNLVDSEGFPRSDIDVPVVRADRRRLAELRNDHTEITEKINQNIQILHSARHTSKSSPLKDSGNEDSNTQKLSDDNPSALASTQNVVMRDSPGSLNVDVVQGIPFAMVDEITDGSPAAEDGLQLGDQILKFGNVEAGDNLLQKLASEAQTNQGHEIPVVIMRQGAQNNLTVTPRAWQGRGLLGCHFRIL